MAGPVQIGVVVEDEEVTGLIDKLLQKVADIRPVLDGPIDRSVRDFFKAQFDRRGWPGGQPWKPLSPLTVKLKSGRGRGRGGPRKVLWDTGYLRRSFVNRSDPEGIKVLAPLQLTIGSRSEKAARAQYGWTTNTIFGQRRKKTLVVPPRKIVPDRMPAPVVRAWSGMIENYITEGSLKYIKAV